MEKRTDKNGMLEFDITTSGIWYLKTIHMEKSAEAGLTHESNWATLTFQIGEGHDHGSNGHQHSHEEAHDHEGEGIPSYLFWIGSVLVVGILFLVFNRRKRDA
jgi:ABC-type Zn2+ transport system substrate-binding protein/surface adhesin